MRGPRAYAYAKVLMFRARPWLTVAPVDETGVWAETPPRIGADAGMGEGLPTGTVTFLLADVEGSTRLWEAEPEAMTAAVARLGPVVDEVVVTHAGVRPVEQGEGDSFVIAFARASDAVACALDLQRAPLAPLRLRIGIHSGEAEQRDAGNYMGPTVNRTARVRDAAHGGQTVLSGATHDLVVDRLPEGVWVRDLGSHRLRDLARPERIVQLCQSDLPVEFPPLRTLDTFNHNLAMQLTTFIGRETEMAELRRLLADDRLVTVTGAGGAGKTRLALQVAANLLGEFPDGVWQVDLAPVTDPEVVAIAVARALSLTDEPGHSTMDTLARFVADGRALVVLDNCEHLLDASAGLVEALLHTCPALSILATSREPLGVAGEVTWRIPSLSLADEALDLFADRARRARSGFVVADDSAAPVAEICRRLDGIPLAIELAAARVRVLSPEEILAGLQDRFRLLTGGARTAVRRQQTLRASVDWSHALLTEPERVLFRRLAAFVGGFDLDAGRAVGTGGGLASHQVLDQLALLVDKSLVAAEESPHATRYRLLETVRQYALEKLGESGEADAVRTNHRDHFTTMAVELDRPHDKRKLIERAEADIDNLRAAFEWSREISEPEAALKLASSLMPLWLGQGRLLECRMWLDAALGDHAAGGVEVGQAVRARALADTAMVRAWRGDAGGLEQAEEAVRLARQLNDPGLLGRTLGAAGFVAILLGGVRNPYYAEANAMARQAGDDWMLAQILGWQSFGAFISGDPAAAQVFGEEGLALAEETANRFIARQCRTWLAVGLRMQGDLAGAEAHLTQVLTEAERDRDPVWRHFALQQLGWTWATTGRVEEARTAAEVDLALVVESDLGAVYEGGPYTSFAVAAMAAGDGPALAVAARTAVQHFGGNPLYFANGLTLIAEGDLAAGDLTAASRRADEAVATTTEFDLGYWLMAALLTRARVAMALDDLAQAEDDAHKALAKGHALGARAEIADILECLASVAVANDAFEEATRHCGASDAIRRRIGSVRFAMYQAGYDAVVSGSRSSMGDTAFERAWDEGAALSIDEAVAYAQRGRGERKRPSSGWASLTPAEVDVVRLVGEGLANKEIAAQLFVSPRTVQAHLTHVYSKLGVSSRVQLAQEASRHT